MYPPAKLSAATPIPYLNPAIFHLSMFNICMAIVNIARLKIAGLIMVGLNIVRLGLKMVVGMAGFDMGRVNISQEEALSLLSRHLSLWNSCGKRTRRGFWLAQSPHRTLHGIGLLSRQRLWYRVIGRDQRN